MPAKKFKLDRSFFQTEKYQQRRALAQSQGFELRSESEMQLLYDEILAAHDQTQDLWIFAYGSLMWNPIIQVKATKLVSLPHYKRSFCVNLPVFRGTPDNPGLMLALEVNTNASCRGSALAIAAENIAQELPLVWMREMGSKVYLPKWVTVSTGSEELTALVFVVNPKSKGYLGNNIDFEEKAMRIASAAGDMGSNCEYLFTTVSHLDQFDVYDEELHTLARRVKEILGEV